MDAPKPKGFNEFDNLMRKLVKPAGNPMTQFNDEEFERICQEEADAGEMVVVGKAKAKNRYRVAVFGDAPQQFELVGTWDDLIDSILPVMFTIANPSDELEQEARDEVRDMLENGIDGSPGWDGKHVHVDFEDGSLQVDLI